MNNKRITTTKKTRIIYVLIISVLLFGLSGNGSVYATDYYSTPFQRTKDCTVLYSQVGIKPLGITGHGVDGWVAIDLKTEGFEIFGHCPPDISSMSSGTAEVLCQDSHQEIVKIGGIVLGGLAPNSVTNGTVYAQNQWLAYTIEGTWTDTCGNRSALDYVGAVVTVGFPDGNLNVGDWVLDRSSGNWTHGSNTSTPGQWINLPVANKDGSIVPFPVFQPSGNLWSFLLSGGIWIIQSLVMPLFGDHTSQAEAMNLGGAIGKNTMMIFQLMWLSLSAFNLGLVGIYFAIALGLKATQIVVAIWMFLKSLIPFL